MYGDLRFYLDKPCQFRALAVGKHTAPELYGLYGEDAHLLQEHFPRYGKEGEVNGVDARRAQEVFLSHSGRRLWSPADKARGRGCWLAEDGSLIVNTGTAVFAGNAWRQPGLLGNYALVAR